MQKWMKRLVWALYGLAAVLTVLRGGEKAILGPVSLLFLLIPPVMAWLLRRPLGTPLGCAVLLFCLMGFHLGTALDWYHRFLGFDKLVHLISGAFFYMIGGCLYAAVQREPARRGAKPLLEISYAFFFAMAVASVWEIFEYVGFLLTGHDAQNVATTGIHDTMQDMLACLFGAGLAILDYLAFLRWGRSPLMALIRSFDHAADPRGEKIDQVTEKEGSLMPQVHEIIDRRRSVRAYDPNRPVTDEQVETLLRAAMLAPSAHNGRPWAFAVVRDPALRERLRQNHPYAGMLATAPLVILVLAKPKAEAGHNLHLPQDCGAATENLLLQATAMGLGSCWCGIYPAEDRMQKFAEILSLPEGLLPFAMVAVGQAAETPEQRGHYDPERVIWR